MQLVRLTGSQQYFSPSYGCALPKPVTYFEVLREIVKNFFPHDAAVPDLVLVHSPMIVQRGLDGIIKPLYGYYPSPSTIRSYDFRGNVGRSDEHTIARYGKVSICD